MNLIIVVEKGSANSINREYAKVMRDTPPGDWSLILAVTVLHLYSNSKLTECREVLAERLFRIPPGHSLFRIILYPMS